MRRNYNNNNNNNNNYSNRTYLPDGRSFRPDPRSVAFGQSQFLTGGPDKDIDIDTFAHGNYDRSPSATSNTFGSNGRPAYTTDPRNRHAFELDEYGNTIYDDNNDRYYTRASLSDMGNEGRYDARTAKSEGARLPGTRYNIHGDESKSCLEMLMECLTGTKSRRGGGYMSGDVKIEDLRSFLDSNQDIKNILLNDQCPLNPSEEMKANIQKFIDMLKSYGEETTIAQIYVSGGRKRRSKKTRKPKRRRTRKTRKH